MRIGDVESVESAVVVVEVDGGSGTGALGG
jgi:hypothetical protein